MNNNNGNSSRVRSLLLYLGIPIVIILIMTLVLSQGQKDSHTYSEIVQYFHDDKVESFEVEKSSSSAKIKLSLDDNTVINHKIMDWETFRDDVWKDIEAHNAKAKSDSDKLKFDLIPANDNSFWLELIPTGVLVLALVAFWFFVMRRMGGGVGGREMQFGKAKFKNQADEKKKTTFADVAGADEEKEELEEIVEFLKNPQKYNTLGARIPKGVLLVGPPGTGKTLLAKASRRAKAFRGASRSPVRTLLRCSSASARRVYATCSIPLKKFTPVSYSSTRSTLGG